MGEKYFNIWVKNISINEIDEIRQIHSADVFSDLDAAERGYNGLSVVPNSRQKSFQLFFIARAEEISIDVNLADLPALDGHQYVYQTEVVSL